LILRFSFVHRTKATIWFGAGVASKSIALLYAFRSVKYPRKNPSRTNYHYADKARTDLSKQGRNLYVIKQANNSAGKKNC
jgi:hypothetical protein